MRSGERAGAPGRQIRLVLYELWGAGFLGEGTWRERRRREPAFSFLGEAVACGARPAPRPGCGRLRA